MLFADLVGYTTLSEERDPETVKRIVDGAFERLAADVRNHGGRVDKIVGDAIVALFGAPLAHEDDAERAVRSGLAMLSTLEEYGAEVDLPMQMRVGVNTGEVLVGALRAGGDYTAMGDVVNLASRIQTMADPGEVMVGAATHAATRDAISYDPRGEVTAKGRSRDETVWVATGALRAPGPEHSSADAPLFGRETEMDLLVNATAGSIRHLRGQVVLLIGEAGVGKSRLASELGESLKASHGVRCYSGRCVPYGEANPWWPVAEILRGALEVSAGESAQKVERSTRAAVSAALESEPAEVEVVVEGLLHILGHEGTFDGMEGAAARAEAARALRTYLEALLAQGPLLVRISDLHWADDAILSLIDDLAENLARLPITLVATARRSLLSRWSPSPGRFNSLLLNVDPLDRSAVRQLLEHLLRDAPAESVACARLIVRVGLDLGRALQRADDVPHADVARTLGERVAPARTALAGDEASALQVLEDLLQEPRGDGLSLSDVLDLRGSAVVVERNVEHRAHAVAAFVGQLHGTYMSFPIGCVKNFRGRAGAIFTRGFAGESMEGP